MSTSPVPARAGRMTSWSLRRRVLAASALGILVALLIGIAAFAIALQAILVNAAEGTARALASQIAELMEDGGYDPATAVEELPDESAVMQVISADGTVLAASDDEAMDAPLSDARPGEDEQITRRADVIAGEPGPFAVVALGAETSRGELVTLVVAAPLDVEQRTVMSATLLLAAGALALAAGFLLLIARVLRSALQPVARITDEVAAISAARGSERITVPGTGDEIARLAATMNGMLDRLSRSDAAMRRFVSDASHELRSPIATLRAHLETAPSAAAGGPEREPITVDRELTLGEVDRMHRLVDDLLTIAKADDQGIVLRRAEMDLDDLIDEEVRRLRSIAPGAVRASIVPARVHGDADRIAQILRNITDNALRHTEDWIAITMESPRPGRVRVHVDNAGAPIPPDQREAVFERFTRLDEARARQHGGSGLGLAIAAAFAAAHGGSIEAGSTPQGDCRFTITLPAMREPEDEETP